MNRKKKLCLYLCVILVVFLTTCRSSQWNWSGYQGAMEGYEYYYEDGRERAWEEDILSMAEYYVTQHPWLRNKADKVHYFDREEKVENLFDAEKYRLFVDGINELIPRISNISDERMIYEIQKIIASIRDSHSTVILSWEKRLPFSVEPFFTNEGIKYYIVGVDTRLSEAMFSQLVAINDVPIDEVVERIKPYVNATNEWGQVYNLCGWLATPEMLVAADIIDSDVKQVGITFVKENGKAQSVELEVIQAEEWKTFDKVNQSRSNNYEISYKYWGEKNYWYEVLPEEVLYFRIASFQEDTGTEFIDVCQEIETIMTSDKNLDKVIVDLRGNSGGLYLYGYKGYFLNVLKEAEEVYVLADCSTFSRGVITVTDIKNEVEGAVVVGTPMGEGYILFGRHEGASSTFHFKVRYYSGVEGYRLDNKKVDTTIMPDILIYPKLEDYKNGVDTILEAVLEM